jgi:hypothetical protein
LGKFLGSGFATSHAPAQSIQPLTSTFDTQRMQAVRNFCIRVVLAHRALEILLGKVDVPLPTKPVDADKLVNYEDANKSDMMTLALNVCRARVCTAQLIDSQCGSNDTVGRSMSEIDAILSDAGRSDERRAQPIRRSRT